MKLEYYPKDKSCFKVPPYSALCARHPGWKDVLSFAEKGKVIAYCKNYHGEYRHGTTGAVHYVDPKGGYMIVVVDTHIDSWFEMLQPSWDCIAPDAQTLVDEMENSMQCMRKWIQKV